jgi:hypothetical protein
MYHSQSCSLYYLALASLAHSLAHSLTHSSRLFSSTPNSEEEELAQSAFAAPSAMRGLDARAAVNAAASAHMPGAGDNGDDDDDEDYRFEEKDDMDEDDDDDVQIVSGGAPPPPRLSDMFAAPSHLIHKAGGFQGARTVAKDSKRWLLVNIQKDSDFASRALNRDVWRDEVVENLIREGFIFWQQVRKKKSGSGMNGLCCNVLYGISLESYSLDLFYLMYR